jgi:hypothetical protein
MMHKILQNYKEVGLKYKDKYTSIRDIYNSIKKNLNIPYTIYYNIIKKFCMILIRDMVARDRKVYLPNSMGFMYLAEKEHKRAFHTRVDYKKTKETGNIVTYQVPILTDFYKKIIWVRPTKFRNCKVLPLGFSKKIINL